MDSEQSKKKNKLDDYCHDDHSGSQRKRRCVQSKLEEIFIKELPECEAYEKSYMHRDVISHVLVTPTQFIITCAIDGTLKFWKKTLGGIEFVKHYKCHPGPIQDVSTTHSGSELASISLLDKVVNVFNVINFDMINFIKLEFEPRSVEWIENAAVNDLNLAISDNNSEKIYIFDARQPTGEPKRVLDNIHLDSVIIMKYNHSKKSIISVDTSGTIEYWNNSSNDFKTVEQPDVKFSSKMDTDLYEFVSDKSVHHLQVSPSGDFFATLSSDRKVRIFKYKSGKIVRTIDESLETIEKEHKENSLMNPIDFLRKMTIEKELNKSMALKRETILFDQSGNFVIYPSMLGIKIVDWKNQKTMRILGKCESLRPLSLAVFQGMPDRDKISTKFLSESEDALQVDPSLFCSAHKMNRFYIFSNKSFEESTDRDIFNEPPTEGERLLALGDENLLEPGEAL